ncbi:MAG: bifunctional riboflavin kinase/FAD synthetase [Ruminococcaceae bacterium]|nr:bifunctional riboflavin kinase/FAD synthetase [Oscillospiraceae bacterium]
MKQRVIALGLFDGVHLGHGALLSRARERALALGATSAALTFSTPPAQVVTGKPVALINTPSERTQLIQTLYQIEEVLMLPFDASFASRTWDAFLTFLSETYHACHIVAGFDFRFGAGGMGDAARLRTFCASHGIGCDILDPVTLDGIKVSSTHIRTLIRNGEMEEAARFLGHPHFMMQSVSEGQGLGHTLNAPTMNHTPDPAVVLPPFGVYATRVYIDGAPFLGATNIGVRPSVSDENKITVETHLLDFSGDLYGKKLPLEFLAKIRDERKFPSKDALSAQIHLDIETIRNKKRT